MLSTKDQIDILYMNIYDMDLKISDILSKRYPKEIDKINRYDFLWNPKSKTLLINNLHSGKKRIFNLNEATNTTEGVLDYCIRTIHDKSLS